MESVTQPIEKEIRQMLLKVCARHLWMALPEELEDYIVAFVVAEIDPGVLNEKPGGSLCAIATECAWAYHTGWLDLDNPQPYTQMPEPSCDIPEFEVIGPHETWVRVTHEKDCPALDGPDDEFYERTIEEYNRYGFYYLR